MNHPDLGRALAADRIVDLQKAAERGRSARRARPLAPAGLDEGVVIREAAPVVHAGLVALAVLDESTVPTGRILLALVKGQPVAAVGSDGDAIADPFRPTEALVAELRRRIRELDDGPRGGGRSLAWAWSWATPRS